MRSARMVEIHRDLIDERGSSLVEFVVVGLLAQMLILSAGVFVVGLQRDQLAAESIARHALRSQLLHGLEIDQTVADLSEQFGVVGRVAWRLDCSSGCADPGDLAALRVSIGPVSATSYLPVPG